MFFCLLQAGERNFLSSYSRNLGFVDVPIPVLSPRLIPPPQNFGCLLLFLSFFPLRIPSFSLSRNFSEDQSPQTSNGRRPCKPTDRKGVLTLSLNKRCRHRRSGRRIHPNLAMAKTIHSSIGRLNPLSSPSPTPPIGQMGRPNGVETFTEHQDYVSNLNFRK